MTSRGRNSILLAVLLVYFLTAFATASHAEGNQRSLRQQLLYEQMRHEQLLKQHRELRLKIEIQKLQQENQRLAQEVLVPDPPVQEEVYQEQTPVVLRQQAEQEISSSVRQTIQWQTEQAIPSPVIRPRGQAAPQQTSLPVESRHRISSLRGYSSKLSMGIPVKELLYTLAGISVAIAANGGASDDSTPPPQGSAEYAMQAGLSVINAQAAFDRGLTGAGIKIGIIDQGLYANHSEFAGRVLGCYNAGTGLSVCGNIAAQDHGTHVAGIAAAAYDGQGMMGVAYKAKILNADIFNGQPTTVTDDQVANAVNWMVSNGADVVNNSWGISGPYDQFTEQQILDQYGITTNIGQAYDNAANQHVIMVWATGNTDPAGASQPSLPPALPLYSPQLQDSWVAVTAVSAVTKTLASYANKCGDAADFCIAAPGGDDAVVGIYSTLPGGGYGVKPGTSMAAPHVSGAVALLLQEFGPGTPTNKTPEQVVQIMLETANKTGVYADTTIYGQGLLDLDQATSPDSATLSFNGASLVRASGIQFGPAFGNAAPLALRGQTAGATDRFGRVFMIDLGTLAKEGLVATDTYKIIRYFDTDMQTISLPNFGTLSISLAQPQYNKTVQQRENKNGPQIEKFSLKSELTSNLTLNAFYGINPGTQLGLYSDGMLGHSLLSANNQSINPYFDLGNENGFGTGLELAPNDSFKIRSIAFLSKPNSDPFREKATETNAAAGAAMEMEKKIGSGITISLITGTLREDKSVLGIEHTGSFGLKDDTYTLFAGPSARIRLNDNVSLIWNWQSGWTDAKDSPNSLFSDFTMVRSDSFTTGIVGSKMLGDNDKWGILIHQPLRVTDGQATLSLPQGNNSAGEMQYGQQRVNLAPSGREINLQTFYHVDLEHRQTFSAGLLYRSNPGNDSSNPAEGVAIARFGGKF